MRLSNRFDFVRLVLASLVFIYHLVALSAAEQAGPVEIRLAGLAERAIQGFFIVSGALVYGSWLRSENWADYAGKRFRRLYPAYFVIILVPALISLWISGQAGAVGAYIAANLVFLNFLAPELPGLFADNRFSEVNGALWTLKIEVMFYISLPFIAGLLSVSAHMRNMLLCLLVLASLAWASLVPALDHPMSARLARQLPGQMMFFAAGMTLWIYRDLIRKRARMLLVSGLLILSVEVVFCPFQILRLIGLTCLIAGLAYLPGPSLRPARWGDISYGIYIIHFPIVQMLVAFGLFSAIGVVGASLLSIGLVVILSYALWWLIERPALRSDSHYRQLRSD